MSGRDARLVRGVWLVVVVGALFTLGYDVYARRLLLNPTDPMLTRRFQAHRAEFEELMRLERAHLHAIGSGLTRRDSARSLARIARSDRRWNRLTRDLGISGHGFARSDSMVYFAAAAWLARWRFADVKGYAFSTTPPGNLVEDLDVVEARPRRRGEARLWHRPLEGSWYLFREVGGARR